MFNVDWRMSAYAFFVFFFFVVTGLTGVYRAFDSSDPINTDAGAFRRVLVGASQASLLLEVRFYFEHSKCHVSGVFPPVPTLLQSPGVYVGLQLNSASAAEVSALNSTLTS